MLSELDRTEVSRFAGRYFLLVDDGPLAAMGPPRPGGRLSRFGLICRPAGRRRHQRRDAGPGRGHRQGPLPAAEHPRPLSAPLAGALSIAARDPWPAADAWLAGQIGQTELLVEPLPSLPLPGPFEEGDAGQEPPLVDRAAAAEVGATAAALLLKRRGQSPAQFGLQPAPDGLLARLHVEGYRFSGAEARKQVQQWCQDNSLGEKSGKKL